MVDLDDYARNYSKQYAHKQFETILVAMRRQKVLESMAKYPHRTILEIGCGLEPLFTYVDDYAEYWVVEPVSEFVKNASKQPRCGENVHVVEGFFERVESQLPSEVDFIAVSSLLHEVADPAALLAAIRRHCGESTVVHLNVPNVYSFHRLLALECGLIGDIFEKSQTEARFQRHTCYDRAKLLGALDEAGFTVLDSGTYFVKPFTHSQMEQMLKLRVIDDGVIAGLARMTRHLPELGCEMYVEARRRG